MLILLYVILISSNYLGAQPISTIYSKKAVALYQQAEKALGQRQFQQALELFVKATEKEPRYKEAHFQAGMLYKSIMRHAPGVKYHFEKVYDLDSASASPLVLRLLGEIYMHEGAYALARKFLSKYITHEREPKAFIDKAKVMLRSCDFASKHILYPKKIQTRVLPMEVNRHRKQYFPVTTADQKKLVYTVRDQIGNREYEDIFISYFRNGRWSFSESISDVINTPYNNEGTCSISADGKVLVFTMCGGKGKSDGDCDLYISNYENAVWSAPQNMGAKVNSPSWDSQPSLSADGKTLYFSSKRKGGMGEEDIWVSTSDANGNWSEPLNLGDVINTPGREVAPFIHPSAGTLYFASDFHPGFGSFDLFVSYKDSINWNEPINLGYPVNTHLEESSIFVTADCQKAYISAEAVDTKGQNSRYFLYEFDLPKDISCSKRSTYASGFVYNNKTKQPLGADIQIVNLSKNKQEGLHRSDNVTGEYLTVLNENTTYALFVSKPGFLYQSHTFDFVNEAVFDPVHLDVYLEPIEVGSVITLENIFFKTGEYKLDSESFAELDKLVDFLNQNIFLKVEISGHTDNIGKKQDNLVLSTKRAESVVEYLIDSGIQKERIMYKGYGDQMPKSDNSTEQGRRQNRRIECKVL